MKIWKKLKNVRGVGCPPLLKNLDKRKTGIFIRLVLHVEKNVRKTEININVLTEEKKLNVKNAGVHRCVSMRNYGIGVKSVKELVFVVIIKSESFVKTVGVRRYVLIK